MARRGTVTDQHRERVADLHARGYGRNAIARELGFSPATITTITRDLGLDFDRAATKQAVAARKADAAAKRSELEDLLLDDALRLRAAVHQPHTYREYGGKDFIKREWTQDEPAPVDKLKLMQAAGNAIDRAIRLGEMDRADEVDAARSMLVSLFEQFDLVVEHEQAAS